MDSSQLIIVAFGLLFIGSTIYVANWQDATGERSSALRWMLLLIVGMMLFVGLNVLAVPFLPSASADVADTTLPSIGSNEALLSFGVTLITVLVSVWMIFSATARRGLRRILSASATFNPESSVHLVAVVLSLALVSYMVNSFVLGGGLTGLAETIEATGIAPGEVVFQAILFVIVAFLGVGLAMRRTLRQTLDRLGLRVPSTQEAGAGIAAGSILFLVSGIILAVWQRLVSPDLFTNQTVAAEQIGQAINSLPLAFLVAFSAGVGEEIFFRGALQPVFGIVPTSLLFVAIHSQYTLTPAAVLLLVVAFGLGWVRNRYGTTAAIIAHFAYDFIPLLISVLVGPSLGN